MRSVDIDLKLVRRAMILRTSVLLIVGSLGPRLLLGDLAFVGLATDQ
jgi:hypothetical protein